MNDWRTVLEGAQAAVPDANAVDRAVGSAASGRSVAAVTRLRGGLGAVLHRIDLHPEAGKPNALVLRQLMPEWGETPADLDREATTVDRLDRSSDVPVPSVYYRDPSGDVFGRPAMLIEFIEGNCLIAELGSPAAIATLSRTLASIHDAQIDLGHLRRFDTPADHLAMLQADPSRSEVVDAEALRSAAKAAVTTWQSKPGLVHGDFHGGNVLWDGADATAVLDWPLAAAADRWWDEAYAHMDTWLAHGEDTAAAFRAEYRTCVGDAPGSAHQRFWDLTALVRALPSPGQWLDAYNQAGVADLTTDVVERRYVEMVDRAMA